MDMQTVGVLSNDRGDGLSFPLPFPAIPDLLFQGRTVSRGSRAWLPSLVSISDARHQVAGVMRGCHKLKCLLSWMRNNTEKSLSPAKVKLRPVRDGGAVIQVGSQIHSYFLVMVWKKAYSTSQGWEARDKMLQLLLNWETALAGEVNDWWLICPEHMSKEQASSCKLFSPCLNQERAAILVKWQMLLPVIQLSKNAFIFRNMGWCVLVSKGYFLLFILTCLWHIPCYLFLEFSSWVVLLTSHKQGSTVFLQKYIQMQRYSCNTACASNTPEPLLRFGPSLLYRHNCDHNENPISQKFKAVVFHLGKGTHNCLLSFLCHYSS